jgi:hypothetical protein
MPNFILFALSFLWIGAGSWACIYSNDSKIARLLAILTLFLGIGVLSYSA